MNPVAYEIYQNQKDLTRHEIGVSDKKIIIPSFNTTGKLFTQHFHILRELKHRIDRLKQAYESQRSEQRSWAQINEILKVLANACYFLDFPED